MLAIKKFPVLFLYALYTCRTALTQPDYSSGFLANNVGNSDGYRPPGADVNDLSALPYPSNDYYRRPEQDGAAKKVLFAAAGDDSNPTPPPADSATPPSGHSSTFIVTAAAGSVAGVSAAAAAAFMVWTKKKPKDSPGSGEEVDRVPCELMPLEARVDQLPPWLFQHSFALGSVVESRHVLGEDEDVNQIESPSFFRNERVQCGGDVHNVAQKVDSSFPSSIEVLLHSRSNTIQKSAHMVHANTGALQPCLSEPLYDERRTTQEKEDTPRRKSSDFPKSTFEF